MGHYARRETPILWHNCDFGRAAEAGQHARNAELARIFSIALPVGIAMAESSARACEFIELLVDRIWRAGRVRE